MVQNAIGGLQGIVDQAMVGHYIGYIGNAAVGASLQIFILVIVFVSSVFTGMSVLVARFAGGGDSDKRESLGVSGAAGDVAARVWCVDAVRVRGGRPRCSP